MMINYQKLKKVMMKLKKRNNNHQFNYNKIMQHIFLIEILK